MKNKLVISAAGSGKTTYLVSEAISQRTGRVLITTYTLANEMEIRKKFIEMNGCIPSNVTIQTWFSFLLQHGVRPYQSGVYDNDIRGMILVNEASGIRTRINGRPIPYSETTHFSKHYFNKDSKVYSDKISKLVIRCNENSDGAVFNRLSKIFGHIFIDEVQDLAGYDLEIIKNLFQSNSIIRLVGDPRQVTYLTHLERKYSRYREGQIKEFIERECRGIECDIDEVTLNSSYRNNESICNYSSRLYPMYEVSKSKQTEVTGHDGLFLVKEGDVDEYLNRFNPVQLRDNIGRIVNNNYRFHNFGDSKGLTFDRVLIYPTKPFINWIENNNSSLAFSSRAKFYVAITRAKYSVGIVYNFHDSTEIEGFQKYIVTSL